MCGLKRKLSRLAWAEVPAFAPDWVDLRERASDKRRGANESVRCKLHTVLADRLNATLALPGSEGRPRGIMHAQASRKSDGPYRAAIRYSSAEAGI
jgi:hypothetical protein